ncbi:hypothetical protein GUA87_01740 [Sneathiella sp. P13V-1]|uniref:hypothetical protein n=1 Tax=Sneathiella sp. P13V-1 TaxID=2697366 RepID=UPI00187B30C1|nr:hypothetical protein [Sneathiella sp. P13V-1]MBE7635550.1 hypothetical protein [Sneathiella sp. P13V-1]
MHEEPARNNLGTETQWYEQKTPIRGCSLSLPELKKACKELETLNRETGMKIIRELVKPDDTTEAAFDEHKKHLLEDAFKVTSLSLVMMDRPLMVSLRMSLMQTIFLIQSRGCILQMPMPTKEMQMVEILLTCFQLGLILTNLHYLIQTL